MEIGSRFARLRARVPSAEPFFHDCLERVNVAAQTDARAQKKKGAA
jgi:hypothetical protein